MRNLIPMLISSVIFFTLVSCDAESITQPPERPPETESEFTYGGTNDDLGKILLRTEDGGYLIVGTTTSSDGLFNGLARGNRDVFALKLNANRNQQWVRTYGGSNSEWAMDVIQDSQGNFVITGYSRSNDDQFANQNRGENDIFLIKIGPDGSLIWTRQYGGSNEDYGFAVTEGPNGGYVIAGSTRSVDGNFSNRSNLSKDIFVMLTDFNGQPNWIRTYGGSNNDEALDVVVGPNSQIAVTGFYESFDNDFSGRQPGESGAFLLKMDPSGLLSDIYTYSGSGAEIGKSLTATSDNGFAIAGRTTSNDGLFQNQRRGDTDAFLLKTNSFGNIQWLNVVGGSNFDELNSIIETDNSRLIAVGDTRSSDEDFDGLSFGGQDLFMVDFSLNGTLNRLSTYGGSADETAQSVVEIPGGNIGFTGWTQSNDGDFSGPPKVSRDIYMLLTSPDGAVQ